MRLPSTNTTRAAGFISAIRRAAANHHPIGTLLAFQRRKPAILSGIFHPSTEQSPHRFPPRHNNGLKGSPRRSFSLKHTQPLPKSPS
jgi:hypothetical protein